MSNLPFSGNCRSGADMAFMAHALPTGVFKSRLVGHSVSGVPIAGIIERGLIDGNMIAVIPSIGVGSVWIGSVTIGLLNFGSGMDCS